MAEVTPAGRTFPELFFAQVRRGGQRRAAPRGLRGLAARVLGGIRGGGAAGGRRPPGAGPRPRGASRHPGRQPARVARVPPGRDGGGRRDLRNLRDLLARAEPICPRARGGRDLFVDNAEQLEKALTVLDETAVERIVVWDAKGLWGFADARVTLLRGLLKQGHAFLEADRGPARRDDCRDRGGRRRDDHLHLGDDRAAQGSDALAPQHPVGDRVRRPVPVARARRRRRVVSPVRARLRELHVGVLAGPAGDRRELRRERGHALPEPAGGLADLLRGPPEDLGEAGVDARPAHGRLDAVQARDSTGWPSRWGGAARVPSGRDASALDSGWRAGWPALRSWIP